MYADISKHTLHMENTDFDCEITYFIHANI